MIALRSKQYDGFSLLELVVVIAIIATLSLILVPSFSNYNKKAEIAKDKANARTLYTMASLLKEQHPGISDLELLNRLKENTEISELDNVVVRSNEDGQLSVIFNEQVYPDKK